MGRALGEAPSDKTADGTTPDGTHPPSDRPSATHDVGGYEVAEEETGIGRPTLYSLVHQNRIPHIRLSRRLVRFRRSDLRRWMSERLVRAK